MLRFVSSCASKDKVTKWIGKNYLRRSDWKCFGGCLYFKIAESLVLLSRKERFTLKKTIQSSCRSWASRSADSMHRLHGPSETLSIRWVGQSSEFNQWQSCLATVKQATLCFHNEGKRCWAFLLSSTETGRQQWMTMKSGDKKLILNNRWKPTITYWVNEI